jgi:Ser/Thr protein kinase RdoA (MazF antagonist)
VSVERVGASARRPPGVHAELVHALFAHFERVGFEGAPRFLGLEGDGREVLSWIDGEAGGLPAPAADEVAVEISRLMRRMHDAQAGFEPPEGYDWDDAQVVCHNDWWPGNLIFRSGRPVALIDWGLAAPGSRVQDLARAAAWWAPLRPGEAVRARGLDPARRGERLRLMCDAYGLDEPERRIVVDAAIGEQLLWAENPPGEHERRLMLDNARWMEENREELARWL